MSTGRAERAVATASAGGMSTAGAFAVALVVLKLCGVITWSWLWVLAPVWIGAALAVLGLAGFVFLVLAVARVEDGARVRRREDPRPDQHGPARRWRR